MEETALPGTWEAATAAAAQASWVESQTRQRHKDAARKRREERIALIMRHESAARLSRWSQSRLV